MTGLSLPTPPPPTDPPMDALLANTADSPPPSPSDSGPASPASSLHDDVELESGVASEAALSSVTDSFYEGTEKLLEIWFHDAHTPDHSKTPVVDQLGQLTPAAVSGKPADLRAIPRPMLDELLGHVNATIISRISTPDTDAYVLSESSMFVSARCLILKTCGSTTLIKAIQPLLQFVHKYTCFTGVEDLFYSRKDFLRPELQDELHRCFDREVKYLDNDLGFQGSAYCLGRVNDQCWYLYCLGQRRHRGPPGNQPAEDDQSLEVMMEQLDPAVMEIFTRRCCSTAQEATAKAAIDSIIPGLKMDDFLFDPCGYSMNGLLPSGHYVTIHVTPQSAFSYVSFETNVPASRHLTYLDILQRVLHVFKPGKFLFTLYSSKKALASLMQLQLDEYATFEGYKKMDVQVYSLRNYLLSYLSYVQDIT
ncbi:S-adenosylmethionine decarboxylase proenzyme-like [Paramacrobiotus metropolitanus]|uniref:S-adenosylmethionine decarboxylase proenzyme-like n=1 Tax=Paramacrobiotus metropolitanus TaxID=2943436 RepID=UPI00244645DC|nr:S-adenosylmethionine decarboxylase proenzyme-like [Paramacrobiotus metropolitanus]XP_055355234.1 S-adenosylmethionine decarboxylase proenzyme-like [Paramacrobiotus metropolitanus]